MTGSYSLSQQSQGSALTGILGRWKANPDAIITEDVVKSLLAQLNQPLIVVDNQGRKEVVGAHQGSRSESDSEGLPIAGLVPAVLPEQLGDPGFCRDHGLRFPYISGAMANGIGSAEIAEAMARAGMLGFFGAAGLSPTRIEETVKRLRRNLGDLPFGVNMIHAPQEPQWEEKVCDLLIANHVHLVEASAYLSLTPAVVRYRCHGIHEDELGRIVTPNNIIAKVSRIEVATRFFSPPPQKILDQLVAQGHLTADQARLAAKIPMAQDLTAEADSGGHTDNRPAITMMPTMMALRDRMQVTHGYHVPLRVGLAGGISTPSSAAAAFAMGAAFVLVGSAHQACRESGTSDVVRQMLATTQQADIAMAPAADMFEMGVNLQVLKRGTMFAMRAQKLYELYRAYEGLHALPANERENLEKKVFKAPLDDIWKQTEAFFTERDPVQIDRASRDTKHKMALVFRWYLGKSSGWANSGDPTRRIDYQVWCGPAMGAFNEWVSGSYLEGWENRRVVSVAHNILAGAAYLVRLNALRNQGFVITPKLERVDVLDEARLKEIFQ